VSLLICLAIALHDVDGPIHCETGEKIRLQGIGATETDGTCQREQPCIPGDPWIQRRIMAKAIGVEVSREDTEPDGQPSLYGQLWFREPVALSCDVTGGSYGRITAWCQLKDGRDLSCLAIRAGVALRWPRYDPESRLLGCQASTDDGVKF
jgi:endonuclease YncB( thermonuclease family)